MHAIRILISAVLLSVTSAVLTQPDSFARGAALIQSAVLQEPGDRVQDVPEAVQSAVDTSVADTSAGVDTLGRRIPPVVVLSDSQRRALDSVAVAALTDTTLSPRSTGAASIPVEFYGRTIFHVYSGLGPYDVQNRAERLSRRLRDVAASTLDLDSLRIVEGANLTTLQLGDVIVMTVTEDDASGLGLSRRDASIYYAGQIREEIAQVREQSTIRSTMIRIGIALLLLIALLLAIKGLARLFGWVDRRVAVMGRAWIRPIVIGKVEVVSRDRIVQSGQSVLQLTRIIAAVFLVYIFLTTAFGLFPRTRAWSHVLLGYLISPIQALGRNFIDALPNVLAIIVIIVIVRWAIKLSNFIFDQIGQEHLALPGFYPEFAEPTRKIVRFLLVVFAVLLIYPYTPIADSPVFQGLTIFLGVLVSLGSSTAVSNVVAGVVLTYTRSFRIGDRIRVAGTVGDVIEKTFLVTRLRTPKNEDIAIPNSTMLSNQIINYSSMTRSGLGVVLNTKLTIGYDVPWPDVHRLLVTAAQRTIDIEAHPKPFVLQTALGDFSVEYELNAYTMAPQRMPQLYSDLHQNIQDAFAEENLEILSPVYEANRDGSSSTVPRRTPRGGAGKEGV